MNAAIEDNYAAETLPATDTCRYQAGTLKTPALASMSDGDLSTVIDFGGCGVFKLDASGKLAVLYAFQDSPDGQGPPGECRTLLATCTAPHTAAVIGALGTVFKINPTGKETILHSFTGRDGQNPYDTLLQDHKGNLYGTSSVGGSGNGEGVVFKIAAN
jgi:uncharacterized repeat protein (TIGR03803 family)